MAEDITRAALFLLAGEVGRIIQTGEPSVTGGGFGKKPFGLPTEGPTYEGWRG